MRGFLFRLAGSISADALAMLTATVTVLKDEAKIESWQDERSQETQRRRVLRSRRYARRVPAGRIPLSG